MSSLWTPGGEHPVDRDRGGPAPGPGPVPGAEELSPEDEERAMAMAEQLAEAQRRLAEVPAAVVVANHVMGLFELGAIHLGQQPPNLVEARLAIDAMGAVLDGLRGRLGQDETTLRAALDQIRLAYVQLQSQATTTAGGSAGADQG
ncbi:MAG TPA: hypothetical protein VGB14_06275 [Acidimicrobiales bacterium]|jgi:hypothetical protein